MMEMFGTIGVLEEEKLPPVTVYLTSESQDSAAILPTIAKYLQANFPKTFTITRVDRVGPHLTNEKILCVRNSGTRQNFQGYESITKSECNDWI